MEKVWHKPFFSKNKPFLFDKVDDFLKIPKSLVNLCNSKKVDLIVCRSSMAGALGYLVWRKTKIPYLVESFEPHAEYMIESKVWSKLDPRYWLQLFFEKKQKETAQRLITVSENYKSLLFLENLKCPVDMIPCTVDIKKFAFTNRNRKAMRDKLKIDAETTVGVYVGKFGGIYYNDDAFNFFKSFTDRLKDFFLILVTPEDPKVVKNKLSNINYPMDRYWLGKVTHDQVSNYLCAADFAFCPVKPTAHRKYCSPIKNAEYWANGLPILIPNDIGDDSEIIEKNGGGVIVDFTKPPSKREYEMILEAVSGAAKNRISNISVKNAAKHRNPKIAIKIYQDILTHK